MMCVFFIAVDESTTYPVAHMSGWFQRTECSAADANSGGSLQHKASRLTPKNGFVAMDTYVCFVID